MQKLRMVPPRAQLQRMVVLRAVADSLTSATASGLAGAMLLEIRAQFNRHHVDEHNTCRRCLQTVLYSISTCSPAAVL
jgi:hypothetical protein